MMELSIIIVNWNTKDLLLDCIKSIIDSKPKVGYEIIVVDNGSTDGSRASIKRLQNSLPAQAGKTPRLADGQAKLQLIENKENIGYSKANNQGIKAARGKYIFLLNSDTKVKKDAIDNLIEFSREHPEAGIVGSRLLNPNGTIQDSCFKAPGAINAIREHWFGEKELGKFAPRGKDVVEVDVVVGASFLITPAAREKVGFLDERYFFFWEDLAYCRKVKKSGLKVYYLPSSEVYHYHGSTVRKVTGKSDAWRKLVPGSKIYHGVRKHCLITAVIRLSQKLKGFLLPLLIIFLIIPSIWQLLRPGFFSMQDDLQAFRVHQMDKCFDDKQIPCRWVPDAGYQYGYPQFNYYPPLPYYLGALLHRIGFQYIDSVKTLFILGYIFSAIAMYILVKSLLGKWPALIAALLYTYIPYKAVEVYVRGALSEFWAQIFFPLILWATYKLIKTGKIKYLIGLSITLAALATTHLLMTVIFVPVVVVWACFWLFKYRLQHIKQLIFSGVLSVGLSAFFVLPVIFERQFVHLESLLSGYFDYRAHFVSLQKLFLSMEWGYGSSGFPDEKLNLSLGIPDWLLGLGILGVLGVWNYNKKKKIVQLAFVLFVLTLVPIFMIHLRSSFIWSKLPFLWYLQFPWRFLAISIFLICLLAGFAIYFSGRFKYLLGIFGVLGAFGLYINFFVPKDRLYITDAEKFSGKSWEKQLTISIFDYLPIYATLPPNHKASELPEVLDGEAKFRDYKKGSDYQEGKVEVVEDSTLRLPLFDFPGMKVEVDGEKVVHRNDDCRGQEYCFGLITFDIKKGLHTVSVKLTNTPIRNIGNWLTLGGFGVLAILGYLVVKSRRNAKILG